MTMLHDAMYSEALAADLLCVPRRTLHHWLEGRQVRGRIYRPVIRPEPHGGHWVTWGEFVEASLLREYRRTARVPLPALRMFFDALRTRFQVPYPLADRRPFVSGRRWVAAAQEEVRLAPEHRLVTSVKGRLVLTPWTKAWFERVTWEHDEAAAWRPVVNPRSPVRIDPARRFGAPAVGGISTAALWDQCDAGEAVEEVAEAFALSVRDVRWALAYESSMRAA